MVRLELPIALLAVIAGISATTAAIYAYARHRTAMLRYFVIFDSSLFCIALGFALRSLAAALRWLASGSVHEAAVGAAASVVVFASTATENVGAVVQAAILASFVASLFDRQPSPRLRNAGLGIAVAEALLFVAYVLIPSGGAFELAGSGLMFANIAICLWYAFRLGRERARGAARSALVARSSRPLIRIFIVTACFVPLFIADILISNLPEGPFLLFIDNTSMPLYFIAINALFIALLWKEFDHPPLLEGDKVSDYAKSSFGLTAREAEVLEYVIDGYTLKDLAGVLDISPKTAENHLYSVYQKTGVTNRIQLFQVFANQRRED